MASLNRQDVDLHAVAALVVEQFRAAPCAVLGAAIRRGGRWRTGWGAAGRLWARAQGPCASLDTLFDLASLTKPVVALSLARAERGGRLERRQALGELLPSLADTAAGGASLDRLSAHRAGLEAHREFFIARRGAAQPSVEKILRQAADARRPSCNGRPPPGGFAPVYSDLGYILLGAALAHACRKPLDQWVAEQVSGPLGLRLGSVRRLRAAAESEAAFAEAVAPTEDVPWRGGVLRACVHDENAWVLAGYGTAGHAGLFGDVRAVVGLGVAIVDVLRGERDDWLSAAELAPLVEPRPGGTLCAGFDRRGPEQPASGRHFGARTFGHLGFTGTSLWIDPDRSLVGVLLTNRVHFGRQSTRIRDARPAAYDALFERMTR